MGPAGGGWMSRVGNDTVAVLEVRGEHAVVSGEMDARVRYEGGGSLCHHCPSPAETRRWAIDSARQRTR